MYKSNLRHAVYATLFAAAAHAPASSALVKEQNVRDAFGSGAPSVTVGFADLDIARGTGAEVLYQRLRAAARSVCGTSDGRNINASAESRKCFEQALDEAVSKVNSERVTEIHRG